MKSRMATILGAVACAFLLAACANKQLAKPTTPPAKATGITTMNLLIEGTQSNIALSNAIVIRNALKDYGGNTNPGNLGQLIQQIKASNVNPSAQVPGLSGLGGILGHGFLDVTSKALAGNGKFDRGKRVVVSMSGQIMDYAFNETGTTGYGTGYLEVITYVTTTVVPAGLGAPPPKTEAYKWKVSVIDDGYEVVGVGNNPTTDPFPGTMTFSDEMIVRINSLEFTHKLWAKGEKVIVDEVWRDANYNSNHPNFVQLSSSNPKYARLFEPDPESCIDMMFAGYPPATKADLLGPPFYCLGRCANPALINTR